MNGRMTPLCLSQMTAAPPQTGAETGLERGKRGSGGKIKLHDVSHPCPPVWIAPWRMSRTAELRHLFFRCSLRVGSRTRISVDSLRGQGYDVRKDRSNEQRGQSVSNEATPCRLSVLCQTTRPAINLREMSCTFPGVFCRPGNVSSFGRQGLFTGDVV